MPVHPHVHGELAPVDGLSLNPDGSSPRAWGTRDAQMSWVENTRFIPTCMGNSRHPTNLTYGAAVHPHVHGELIRRRNLAVIYSGSSPRAWGTQTVLTCWVEGERFIPTCMGNSGTAGSPSPDTSVHPHVHGELS